MTNINRVTRRAPYGFSLNDYPLHYQRHGSLHAYRRDWPRNRWLDGSRRSANWMARSIVGCSWTIALVISTLCRRLVI
jgi:hypothetical protein